MWWLAIIAAIWQAYSQYQAGSAEAKMHDYNADVAMQKSRAARKKAALEEDKFRKQGEQFKGSQRAAIGKSGATMESFEPVLADTASQLELDALTIRYGGQLEAIGYKQESLLSRYKAKQTKRSGTYAAVGSLLGGAGRATYMYNTGSSTG